MSLSVREAFSRAFGEVPEGATCHIGADCFNKGWQEGPAIALTSDTQDEPDWPDWLKGPNARGWRDKEKGWYHIGGHYPRAYGPDISQRPAESFRYFFGSEYDKILDEIPPQNPASNEPKIL